MQMLAQQQFKRCVSGVKGPPLKFEVLDLSEEVGNELRLAGKVDAHLGCLEFDTRAACHVRHERAH